MGVHPRGVREPLAAAARILRDLLAGIRVVSDGHPFILDGIALANPPHRPVPMVFGVAGPRLLELSGELADGTLLGLNSAPAYVRWARARIASGAEKVGRSEKRVTVMAFSSVDPVRERARAAVRPRIAEYLSFGTNAATRQAGIDEDLVELLDRHGREGLADAMPEHWIDLFAVAGDADDCRAALRRLVDAGADAIALYPQPLGRAEEVVRAIADLALA
jgi:alkanesulfonate monooxygenase SsuD/methylene tetrahydromethanopterin reductase-like flavin-dependent oxidoreductase (luciferase family)